MMLCIINLSNELEFKMFLEDLLHEKNKNFYNFTFISWMFIWV